jgi:tight adherence protein C
MDGLMALAGSTGISPTIALAALMLAGGAAALAWPVLSARSDRGEVMRRLKAPGAGAAPEKADDARPARKAAHQRAARTAQEFYARTDPENVARLRLRLIQAGYMEPSAVGVFFLIRFASAAAVCLATLLFTAWFGSDSDTMQRWLFVAIATGVAYFAPGLVLSRLIAVKMVEYRNGFPDFMDLMIVCSDAGISMEAAIERVSRELAVTYPSLSQNLQLVSIELRAGRSLDDALKSLADRLSLDEVRSFATLLQQSKELGTSLSGALRVFSDEMRHKRMSLAEEKAHALPAKMSIPVTVCILPVVLMVAIIPIVVRLTALE